MEEIFFVLLLSYFATIITSIFIGRVCLNKLIRDQPKTWEDWGKPKSLYQLKGINWKAYRFMALASKNEYVDMSLFWLSKAFISSVMISYLLFFALVITFIL